MTIPLLVSLLEIFLVDCHLLLLDFETTILATRETLFGRPGMVVLSRLIVRYRGGPWDIPPSKVPPELKFQGVRWRYACTLRTTYTYSGQKYLNTTKPASTN